MQLKSSAQTLEMGLAGGFTLLFAASEYITLNTHKNGYDAVWYLRYTDSKARKGLRHFELNIEQYTGQIDFGEPPGGLGASGFFETRLKEKINLVSITDYFLNFNTLTKKLNISLGLNAAYKIRTISEGFYSVDTSFIPPFRTDPIYTTTNIPLQNINGSEIQKLLMSAAIHTSYTIGKNKWKCKISAATNFGLNSELKVDQCYAFRYRLGLGILYNL